MNAVYVHVYVSFATWLFNDMYMTIPILCFFIHHNSISSFLILGFSTCPLLSFSMPRLLSFMRSCSPVDTHTLVISMCLWMRLMRNQHLMPPCLFWGTSIWKLIVLNTFNQFNNQRSLLTSVFVERGGGMGRLILGWWLQLMQIFVAFMNALELLNLVHAYWLNKLSTLILTAILYEFPSFKVLAYSCLYTLPVLWNINILLYFFFSTNLLHSNRIIDQTISTRTVLAEAVAKQFFGTFIAMQTW